MSYLFLHLLCACGTLMYSASSDPIFYKENGHKPLDAGDWSVGILACLLTGPILFVLATCLIITGVADE